MKHMVDNPEAYFSQWIPDRSDLLIALEEEARREDIRIVGPVVGHLLYLLARLHGARRIVELGTATGYSAIFMANACRAVDGRLITLEADPDTAARATANIDKAGLTPWTEVQCRDALDGLRAIDPPVNMIFMDIEKADYHPALSICNDKLAPGGLLVADNTAFKDAHAFNQAVFDDPGWESVNLRAFLPGHSPEYDGLCIALKRTKP